MTTVCVLKKVLRARSLLIIHTRVTVLTWALCTERTVSAEPFMLLRVKQQCGDISPLSKRVMGAEIIPRSAWCLRETVSLLVQFLLVLWNTTQLWNCKGVSTCSFYCLWKMNPHSEFLWGWRACCIIINHKRLLLTSSPLETYMSDFMIYMRAGTCHF